MFHNFFHPFLYIHMQRDNFGSINFFFFSGVSCTFESLHLAWLNDVRAIMINHNLLIFHFDFSQGELDLWRLNNGKFSCENWFSDQCTQSSRTADQMIYLLSSSSFLCCISSLLPFHAINRSVDEPFFLIFCKLFSSHKISCMLSFLKKNIACLFPIKK